MRWRERGAPATVAGHETTTRHAGALYPFLHESGTGIPGVLIGLDLLGGVFAYDPFTLYGAGLLTNPNGIVFGQIGRGKSSLIKTYLLRQLAFGRRAFVVDPKGEYSALAEMVGVEPIALSPDGGVRLNPLDLGGSDVGDLRARRLGLLAAIVTSSMGRELAPRERAALEAALDQAVGSTAIPTLPTVAAALLDPSPAAASNLATTPAQLLEDGRDVGLELRRLVAGDLRGMFDGATSPSIAADSPLIVLDLSALYGTAALGILMVCATAWLQGLVRTAGAGGEQIIVVVDEAWAVLKDLAVARWLQSAWKLARAWGISCIAVLHRVSDLSAIGGDGSEARQLAEGLLLDSETKVIYAQAPGEIDAAARFLDLTDAEREVVGRLGRGIALWKVGSHSSLVRHLVAPAELDMVNTDAALLQR